MLVSVVIWGQAVLPVTRTTWNSTPTGWTDNAGSAYTTTFACSTSNGAKFDNSNQTYIVNLDSSPNELSFVVKSNAVTSSSLLIQESDDGITYTSIASLSGTANLPTTCTTKGPYLLKTTTRYIKWTFTKSGQNMTMDDVSITKSTATGTSTITTGAAAEPTTISSLNTSLTGAVTPQQNAILNFDFKIKDDGTTAATDALPTKISQLVLNKATGDDFTDWTQAIQGVELSDGTNTTATATIAAGAITFAGLPNAVGNIGYIADDGEKTYSLKIWLRTSLGGTLPVDIDGKNFVFEIKNSGVTFASGSSSLASSQAVNSGATNNEVTVVASKLVFVQQPTDANVGVAMSPAVTVSANDANGNRDRNFTNLIEITSDGTLTGDPVGVNAVNGLATFSSLVHTVAGTDLQMLAGSGAWTTDMSTEFDITLASAANNYFRSRVSGNWNAIATWQSSPDNVTWITSTLVPTSSATQIEILNTHTVSINASGISLTNTFVRNGGTLEVTTGSSYNLSGSAGGRNIQLTVDNGGIFSIKNTGYSLGNGYGLIKTGGKIIADVGSSNVNFLQDYIHEDSLLYFENASICEWNISSYPASNEANNDYVDNLFFSNSPGDLPIFRISNLPANQGYGNSNNDNIINAILELNTTIPFEIHNNTGGGGQKNVYFIGGIRGNGTFIQKTATGPGQIILGDATHIPELGGNVTIQVRTNRLKLPNGANVRNGANVIVQRNDSSAENGEIDRQGGILDVNTNGILDITNMRITNVSPGGVTVNGTLRTSNTGGLNGLGSAIVDGTLTINNNSTIDYYATLNQVISSAPNYYNITFSGAGVKTTQGPISVNDNGLVKITGTTTVVATSNIAAVGGNNTAFTMDGGRLRLETGGTLPLMGGAYNLTGGTVEFASASATSIRTNTGTFTKQYYNIDVSGSNVESGGKNLIVNNLLRVTNASALLTILRADDSEAPYVVTAKKGIQVVAGKALFKNGAQLMQDATGVSNSGSIEMEREVYALHNNFATKKDYVYWSSPVANRTISGFSPGTLSSDFLVYRESDNYFEPTGDTTFQVGKGYAVGAETGLSNPYAKEYTFAGAPHNGTFNGRTLLKSATGGGYNLVGNPYPSNIDLDELFTLNTDRMYSVAYMWTNNSYTPNQMGSGYDQNNYAVYNRSGGNPATTYSLGFDVTNSTIKVGQGFIVQAKTNGSPMQFNNDIRNPVQGTFYEKTNWSKDRFWLQHISPSEVVNTILLGYFNNATENFDQDYDAELFSSPSDVIFSVLNTQKLLIQGKGVFNVNDKISLGSKQSKIGNYIIKLAHKEGLFENGQPIYLHDKLNNTYTNLQETDFVYTSQIGATENRFEIVYQPEATLATDIVVKNQLQVYRDGESFIVKSTNKKIDEVEVYDASGRLFQKVKGNTTELKISAASLSSGMYILKIKRSNETISKKIMK